MEASQDTEARVAGSAHDDRQLSSFQCLRYELRDTLVHERRGGRRVPKRCATLCALDGHANAARPELFVSPGLEQPLGSLARPVPVISGMEGNLDQANVHVRLSILSMSLTDLAVAATSEQMDRTGSRTPAAQVRRTTRAPRPGASLVRRATRLDQGVARQPLDPPRR